MQMIWQSEFTLFVCSSPGRNTIPAVLCKKLIIFNRVLVSPLSFARKKSKKDSCWNRQTPLRSHNNVRPCLVSRRLDDLARSLFGMLQVESFNYSISGTGLAHMYQYTTRTCTTLISLSSVNPRSPPEFQTCI